MSWSSCSSTDSHAVTTPCRTSVRQHSASSVVFPNPPGACSKVRRRFVGKQVRGQLAAMEVPDHRLGDGDLLA